jgi:hypothetical protein
MKVLEMANEKKQGKLLKLSEARQSGINVWAQPPVDVVPTKNLDSWSIVKVVEANVGQESFEFHIVGRDINECNGAVSSKIAEFDPHRMQAKTQSGRIYQLVGIPGHDSDADYVLRNWCRINQVATVDATQEFLHSHGVSKESLK